MMDSQGSSEPGHWASRLGIIAMQHAEAPSLLTGSVVCLGDSLQEQRPAMPYGYPFSGLAPTPLYPASSALSTTFTAGLMGIGITDLTWAADEILQTTAPGRVVLSCGTNDAVLGKDHGDGFLTSFANQFAYIVLKAAARVGRADFVLVETIPFSTDGCHDNDLIAAMNGVIATMPEKFGVLFYDLAGRLFCPDRSPRSSAVLSADGLHLGSTGIFRRAFDEQCLFTGQPFRRSDWTDHDPASLRRARPDQGSRARYAVLPRPAARRCAGYRRDRHDVGR